RGLVRTIRCLQIKVICAQAPVGGLPGGRPVHLRCATCVPRRACRCCGSSIFRPVCVALPRLVLIALISDAIKMASDINARIVMPDSETAGEGGPGKFHASFPGPEFRPGKNVTFWAAEEGSAGGREFEDIMLRRVPA